MEDHKLEEATWEREDDMRARYPELFQSGNFVRRVFLFEIIIILIFEDENLIRRGDCDAPFKTLTHVGLFCLSDFYNFIY